MYIFQYGTVIIIITLHIYLHISVWDSYNHIYSTHIFTYFSMGQLSKDDCKDAMVKYAEGQMCFGKKPAREMEILSVKGITALHVGFLCSF